MKHLTAEQFVGGDVPFCVVTVKVELRERKGWGERYRGRKGKVASFLTPTFVSISYAFWLQPVHHVIFSLLSLDR